MENDNNKKDGGRILYNRKYNLEYYNITKCGMTSIVKTLNLTGQEIDSVPEDRRIFTVIRNPLDRFLSSFLYCRKVFGNKTTRIGGGGGVHRTLNKSFYDKDILKSFDLFLTEIEENGFFDGHNNTQMYFLDKLVTPMIQTPREFDKITDFILFEDMDEKLKELVGEDINLLKLNVSSDKDKELLRTKITENKDRILNLYKEDWDLYQKLKMDKENE